MLERSGDTGGYAEPAAGKAGLRKVDSLVVKYAERFEDLMGREISTETADSTLARKAAI